jgi:hypothetical protein
LPASTGAGRFSSRPTCVICHQRCWLGGAKDWAAVADMEPG